MNTISGKNRALEDTGGQKYPEFGRISPKKVKLGLRAIYGNSDPIVGLDKFAQNLFRVAGVLVIGNATLGQERSALVRLYGNADKGALECLHFLQ